MMLYADGPDEPPNWKDRPRIMHTQLTLGDGTLLASDFPPGTIGDPQKGFSIMQTAPDVGRGQAWFDALATGGTVITPYGPTFFWPGFGMVQHRFGTN